VELYARVRRAVVVDKMSEREAARQFGLARETVRKMLRYAVPPGYQRQQPVRRPKLGAWIGVIDQILEGDKSRGKKQRHTAKRIFERLRDEHAYAGGYTIVKDYVRLRKRHHPRRPCARRNRGGGSNARQNPFGWLWTDVRAAPRY
jgi:transposase